MAQITFAGVDADWNDSGDAARAYLKANLDKWEEIA